MLSPALSAAAFGMTWKARAVTAEVDRLIDQCRGPRGISRGAMKIYKRRGFWLAGGLRPVASSTRALAPSLRRLCCANTIRF